MEPVPPVKTVDQEFIAHRLLDPRHAYGNNPLPHPLVRPLHMAEYCENLPPRQTDLCTTLACNYYNRMLEENNLLERGYERLENAKGIHSNMFILTHENPVNYFHLYFKAYMGRQKIRFFAELHGQTGAGPNSVSSCTPVDKTTGSMVNCRYCNGGLRHPPNGGFLGHIPA